MGVHGANSLFLLLIYLNVCVCVQQVNKIYTSEQNPNVLVTKSDLRYAVIVGLFHIFIGLFWL